MGYSLSIGEARLEHYDDPTWPAIHVGVEPVTHSEAPAYGEPTDHENQRWPSYTTWHEFAREVGLEDLMFGVGDTKEWEDGPCLIRDHPGEVVLTEQHREAINKVYYERRAQGKIAGYPYEDMMGEVLRENHEMYDGQFARLTWLWYWVNWAMDHCHIPIFANT